MESVEEGTNTKNKNFPQLNKINDNFSKHTDKSSDAYLSTKDLHKNLNKNHNMTFFQILCSPVYKNENVKKRVNAINLAYKMIDSKLDYLHFIKTQNEFESIKRVLFNEHQNNLISLSYKQKSIKIKIIH